MATTTDLAELKINVLTQSQYDSATKNTNELYLTPAMEDISDKITFGAAWTKQICKAYKVGNLVFYDIQAYAGQVVAGTQYTVATIASGYRPSANYPTTGHGTNANYVPQGLINGFVWSSGDITVRPETATCNYVFISGFYAI